MPRFLVNASCRASIQERWIIEAGSKQGVEDYMSNDLNEAEAGVRFVTVEDEVLGEEEDRTIESIEEVPVDYVISQPKRHPLMQLIAAQAKIDDLDEAVRPIQDTLGQTDGGLAAQFFDGEFDWKILDNKGRQKLLIRYVVFEMGHMEFSL